LLLLGAAPGEPVLRKSEDGAVDWTARVVRATGVGTPKILSPTGALTPRDPYVVAREDARVRLERLLARLRVERGKRLSGYPELDARRGDALDGFTSAEALRFSDGTVHLPVSVPFDWVPAALAGRGPAAVASDAAVTGLLLRVEGKLEPRLRLVLRAGERTVKAGFPVDPLGATGVAFFRTVAEARAWPLLGARPREATAVVKGRALQLAEPDADLLSGVPGAIAVVLP